MRFVDDSATKSSADSRRMRPLEPRRGSRARRCLTQEQYVVFAGHDDLRELLTAIGQRGPDDLLRDSIDSGGARPLAPASQSGTAHWIAAARARESERADRLFDDPYAAVLAGDRGRAALAASEGASGSENEFLPVRTRFFDDSSVPRPNVSTRSFSSGPVLRHPRLPDSACRLSCAGSRSTGPSCSRRKSASSASSVQWSAVDAQAPICQAASI